MKKIMFNDKFLLTKAVLDGRKTQTRRIVPQSLIDKYEEWYDDVCCIAKPAGSTIETINDWLLRKHTKYYIGEIVAVAQSYKDCGYSPDYIFYRSINRYDGYKRETACSQKGWTNKMFVASNLMPHQTRITNVRIERLQDISDDDCLAEGIVVNEPKIRGGVKSYYPCQCLKECVDKIGWGRVYATPREAYADLIDKVSGNGTWEINPWVWAYDFELVK